MDHAEHGHDLAPTPRSRSSRSPETAPRSRWAPLRSTHSYRESHDRPQPRAEPRPPSEARRLFDGRL